MLIDERIEAFSYLVGSFRDVNERSKGDGSVTAIAAPRGQLGRGGQISAELCLRKREVATKPAFTKMLEQVFNGDVADWRRPGCRLAYDFRGTR